MVWGRRPLGAVLHSSDEPGELSQWLCHADSPINIVFKLLLLLLLFFFLNFKDFIIIIIIINDTYIPNIFRPAGLSVKRKHHKTRRLTNPRDGIIPVINTHYTLTPILIPSL